MEQTEMPNNKVLLSKLFKIIRLASDYIGTGYRKTYTSEPTFDEYEQQLNSLQSPLPATSGQVIARIEETVRACTICRLHIARKNAVPGDGPLKPRVMIIGEAPGEEEDLRGKPFVGTAGQYLSKWIEAIKLDRASQCFITNTVKCRPPQNRQPSDDECASCFPYLEEQIAALTPTTILSVGLVASRMLTRRANVTMATLRERVYEYKGIPLCVTYHPSAVLRDQSLRRIVWDDLKRLQSILEQFP